jgi:hypothetical protein
MLLSAGCARRGKLYGVAKGVTVMGEIALGIVEAI